MKPYRTFGAGNEEPTFSPKIFEAGLKEGMLPTQWENPKLVLLLKTNSKSNIMSPYLPAGCYGEDDGETVTRCQK